MEKLSVIMMPGAEGWERWTPGSAGKPVNGDPVEAGGGLVYPISQVTCLPLWAQSGDATQIDGIVAMELDDRRIATDGPGCHYDHRIVDQENSRRQIEVCVIPGTPPMPETNGRWQSFEVSARLYPMPADSLVFWRELGKIVCAFTKGKELVYYQTFGQPELDDDVVQEAACLYIELQQKELVHELEAITLWDLEPDDDVRERLATVFELPLQTAIRPAPTFDSRHESRLLPEDVATARAVERDRARWGLAILGALLLFVVLTGLAILSLHLTRKTNRVLAAKIDEHKAEAEIVWDARNRWETLEPALEPDRYPVELFHQIASLLPTKGMRFTYFELNENQIHITIEATSPTAAAGFRSDLIDSGALPDWEWEFAPQPEVLPNNRARLRMTARYLYGPEES